MWSLKISKKEQGLAAKKYLLLVSRTRTIHTLTQENITTADQALFEKLKAGQHQLLDQLYTQHRKAFIHYACQQLYANEEDAADCFQDALIVFYKNIVGGKLVLLTCSIRTYLFAVGKRMVYKSNRQRQRESPTDLEVGTLPSEDLDLSIYRQMDQDHDRHILVRAMQKIGEPCNQILSLFYYHHYPIESIQTTLGLSSPGAVRVRKLRCLEQLKQLISTP